MSHEELAHPELAGVEVVEDSGDLSRSDVILKGALAAGAVYGTFMVGPYVRKALAMSGGSDVDILNFALTLEYLESTFYDEAKTRAKASGELKSLIGLLADDEKQHVEALTATIKQLGGKPVAEPKFDFPYSDTAGFLEAGADLRGHRGQRLQRRRADDQVQRSARRGRLDRPGRGPARGGDPAAEQGRTGPGSLRPLARRSAGAEGRRTVHRLGGSEDERKSG